MPELMSWGRYPRATANVAPVHWRSDNPFSGLTGPCLPYGLGRSYGDSCLNDGGTLLATRTLDRFISLDLESGLMACEAGVSLGEILDLVTPRGFFLPVVPGTKHVTVGGAIANDVHGKNHHRAGTFGGHVQELQLLRSHGERIVCGPGRDAELFEATVGGLGLTGLILSATLRLRHIGAARGWLRSETIPLENLDDFFARAEESDAGNEFTVAWIDCLASNARVGRGLLHRGNWCDEGPEEPPRRGRARLAIPCELPFCPLNRFSLRGFNSLYSARHRFSAATRVVPYESFFFPLDGVERWNRIYGRHGLLQFQCSVPNTAARDAIRAMLAAIAAAGEGSFLAVLKRFGSTPSPGLLSFPSEGVTLALDFPNRGERTASLFSRLYAMVAEAKGRVYPAKDALMPAEQFERQYGPNLERFRARVDPKCSSSFWRRVQRG
jgi:FAD/FMN-containing dehydrogenase